MEDIQVEVTSRRGGARPESGNLAGGGPAVLGMLASIPAQTLVDAIRGTVETIGRAFTPQEDGPESCELKFGLKISAEGTVVLASMSSELNLEVSVKWARSGKPAGGAG